MMDWWNKLPFRVWRYFYNIEKDELQVNTYRGIEVYKRSKSRQQRFHFDHKTQEEGASEQLISTQENNNNSLILSKEGTNLAEEDNKMHGIFL